MVLSMSVDPEEYVQRAHMTEVSDALQRARGKEREFSEYTHAGRYDVMPAPKHSLPDKGLSERATYQLLKNELLLDGKPGLNLASFVSTWMPDEARQLMLETIGVNLCDQDEYPATIAIHTRCISILSNLWKAPRLAHQDGRRMAALGTATTGSSEALMLGLLAAKRRWQNKRKAEGKDIHSPGPNLVFGANVQVCVEKFARYWDVQERAVPVDVSTNYCLDPKRAMQYVDENTIAVVVIMGSTYTGHFEPVEGMAHELDEYQKKTGVDVPIHVDAASGGMVAPFAMPHHKWSFEIERVKSINTSGHKFGMVYPGIGWIIFRSPNEVPEDLVFELHYLGSVEYSFGLNFSRPAAPMLAQMFNFISLGREGFTATMEGCLMNARLLSRALEYSGLFTVLSDIHRPARDKVPVTTEASKYCPGLPVVSFRWTDEIKREYPDMEQAWVQMLLRAKGWIVPNYELPPTLQDVQILRVAVRANVTENLIETLVQDIISITRHLMEQQRIARELCHDAASATSMTNMILGKGRPRDNHTGRPDVHGKNKSTANYKGGQC